MIAAAVREADPSLPIIGLRPMERVISNALHRPRMLIGLLTGLAGAITLTHLMETLLFEVRPTDPATLASVTAAILCVAILACLAPAVRATRVDPMVALREE